MHLCTYIIYLPYLVAVFLAVCIAVCSRGQQLETHHNHTWQYLENDLTAQAAGSEDAWFD